MKRYYHPLLLVICKYLLLEFSNKKEAASVVGIHVQMMWHALLQTIFIILYQQNYGINHNVFSGIFGYKDSYIYVQLNTRFVLQE